MSSPSRCRLFPPLLLMAIWIFIIINNLKQTQSPAIIRRTYPHKPPPPPPLISGYSQQLANNRHPLTIFHPQNRPKQSTISADGPQQQQQFQVGQAPQLKRVCYFRMDPKTEIRLSQVDGTLCTHIIMAFARMDSFGNLCLARNEDLSYLLEVPQFKRQFPATKVMISVFNENEHNGFPKAAMVTENRQKFARSAMDFLHNYHLDGIDLDWEFPNFPTTFRGREHERLGLTKILKSLRSAIVENYYNRQVVAQREQRQQQFQTQPYINHASPMGASANVLAVEPYILTMAIAAQEAVLKASYELKQVASLCDWLNIMSYDYFLFKLYAPFTGPNSPLHSVVEPYVPIVNKLSISWTLSRLLEEGITKDKIVMGIPTYARAYRLMFRNTQPVPFTLAVGPKGGRIEDYLDYREVSDVLRRPDTIVEFDERARVPYLLTDFGYTWISYENPQSVREKVRYVLGNNLAGYMTWNLNSDDFIGGVSIHQAANLQQPNEHTTTDGISDGNSDNGQLVPLQTTATFPLHRAMFDEVLQF